MSWPKHGKKKSIGLLSSKIRYDVIKEDLAMAVSTCLYIQNRRRRTTQLQLCLRWRVSPHQKTTGAFKLVITKIPR